MTPAGKVWKQRWALVVEVSKLVPPDDLRGAFTQDIRTFLRKPGATPPHPFSNSV